MAGFSSTASICLAPKWMAAWISWPPAAPMISRRSGGEPSAAKGIDRSSWSKSGRARPGRRPTARSPSPTARRGRGRRCPGTARRRRGTGRSSATAAIVVGRSCLVSSVRIVGARLGAHGHDGQHDRGADHGDPSEAVVAPRRGGAATASRTAATAATAETGPTQAMSGTTIRHASAAPARSEKYRRLMFSGRRANSAATAHADGQEADVQAETDQPTSSARLTDRLRRPASHSASVSSGIMATTR